MRDENHNEVTQRRIALIDRRDTHMHKNNRHRTLLTGLDQVVIQSPANSGILAPTGKLGVDSGLPAGFDIYSRLNNGVTEENCGFASLTAGNTSGFYQISGPVRLPPWAASTPMSSTSPFR